MTDQALAPSRPRALRRFKAITQLVEQIGNVDDRQRIGAMHFKPLARSYAL